MIADVVIDGIKYRPEQGPRVGVAITTHNRHDLLRGTIAAFKQYSPDIPIVVVDDGSDKPVVEPHARVFRHDKARGIPAAKNRCIAELMSMGVEHLFLFDDDTRPADNDWWEPYVGGSEPHYSYCWKNFASSGQPVEKMHTVYEDENLVAYGWSMGCMLYVTQAVVRRVGGMRPEFGMGMEEHCEWSQRIHNAGFTTFTHQDIPGSSRLIWAGDEHGSVVRSFDFDNRHALLARNEKIREQYASDDSFVEYRGTRNVVLTSYFTSHSDPQRNKKLPNDISAINELAESTDVIVLHDGLNVEGENAKVPTPLPAYQQRWISEWQWLRAHPEVDFVWLVDATDVVMLNDPFPSMQRGILYAGWENEIVGCDWILEHAHSTREWIENNAHQMLLNCGVVGGDRTTVMQLCQRMNNLFAARIINDPLEEMPFFNVAARAHPRLVTGRQVSTLFKSNTKHDERSWWKHK